MKVAFVFPGQGSQSIGMLDGFGANSAIARTVAEASATLGQDLAALMHSGPAEELGLTTNTQPVMLTAGVAVYRAWLEAGGAVPAYVAGHSLGEYAALVTAGVVSFADGLRLVRLRAQAMQDAVPVGVGAMAAILGLDAAAVQTACAEAAGDEIVEAVNFNDPGQTVIAGHKAAVERACEAARARGAKRALLLAVSAPFHSSLMRPAAERLATHLVNVAFAPPAIELINNVDVAIETDPGRIKDALVRQAKGAVRWVELIQALGARGVTHLVECGPGKVLSGLARRIDRNLVCNAITDAASLAATLELLE
jgi:[acyl-carrier-protein] S-malonyltransferase